MTDAVFSVESKGRCFMCAMVNSFSCGRKKAVKNKKESWVGKADLCLKVNSAQVQTFIEISMTFSKNCV